ncbi:helix-turn-helix transcriptional regulator [Rhodobacteraceae bacterium W635]|uniref:helix-turn-helix transcriptional regulator n=1 Tax=Nioella halotolerans TaxID=2303578 RepID=UPI000E3B9464|nr:helix-turn-helix transcriptional regulator [Rhodobacteraceae bacterium W635]
MKRPFVEQPAIVALLIAAQSACAAFFLWDVTADGLVHSATGQLDLHFGIEAAATAALIGGILFEIRILTRLLRRKAHLEQQASLAARAFHDLVEARFDEWRLTRAEKDVAHFTIKGLSIGEIAGLRGSAGGTVKSQLNAIYRKAEVGNRGEFLSLLIEDLVERRPGPIA